MSSDDTKSYEKPSVENIDTDGQPVATAPLATVGN